MNGSKTKRAVIPYDPQDPVALIQKGIKFKEEKFDLENISETQIDTAEVRLCRRLAEEMLAAFVQERTRSGLTYKKLADRLGNDPALISRRFKGDENLTLRTIAAMFLAMNRDVYVRSVPVGQTATDAFYVGLSEAYMGRAVSTWTIYLDCIQDLTSKIVFQDATGQSEGRLLPIASWHGEGRSQTSPEARNFIEDFSQVACKEDRGYVQ